MKDLKTYRKALVERSSYVENVLIHQLIAGLAGELWRHDPGRPLNIFNPEVDDVGFDIVLDCGGHLRYIQIKQVHQQGAARRFSVRLDFANLPGSCVVVVVYSDTDLSVDHYLFFGGAAGEPMPDVADEQVSLSTSKRGCDGKKKIRHHYRDVPRQKFLGPLSARELLNALFSVGALLSGKKTSRISASRGMPEHK